MQHMDVESVENREIKNVSKKLETKITEAKLCKNGKRNWRGVISGTAASILTETNVKILRIRKVGIIIIIMYPYKITITAYVDIEEVEGTLKTKRKNRVVK